MTSTPLPARSTSKDLAGTTVVATALHFGSAFLPIALTPFVLGTIGIETFGFWALLNRLCRYGLVADIGLGPSVTRHTARYASERDVRAIAETTTIAFLYYGAISFLLVAATLLFGPAIVAALHLSPDLHARAPHAFTLFMLSWAINLALWGTLAALLNGLGLFRTTATINAVGVVIASVSTVIVLALHTGLNGLLATLYIQNVYCIASGLAVALRRQHTLLVNPLTIPGSRYRAILGFGGWVQLSTISSLVVNDTPPLLLGYLVNLEAVALLDIATKLSRVVRAIGYNFSTAFLPMISAVHAREGDGETTSVVLSVNRLMGLVSFTLTGLLIACAPLILRFWLGPVFGARPILGAAVCALALVALIESVDTVATTAIRGMGKPSIEAWFSTFYAAVTLVLCLALVRHFHVAGILAAVISGAVLASASFFAACSRLGILPFRTTIAPWIGKLSLATLAATLATRALVIVAVPHATHRPIAFILFALAALAFAGMLLLALRLVRFFSTNDLDRFADLLPRRASKLFLALTPHRYLIGTVTPS